MPQNTCHAADKGIVLITYTQAVTIGEARDATVAAIALQELHGTNRVLVDARAMTRGPSPVELLTLVESYPLLAAPQRTKVAVLRQQHPDETDLSGFYEVICQNRCYSAKAFDSREAAESWLVADGARSLP